MKGTDITQAQMKAAEQFLRHAQSKEQKQPTADTKVVLPFIELVRLVAWYGAVRFIAGSSGVNSLENPGEPVAKKGGQQ